MVTGISICSICAKEFKWRRCKKRKEIPKYCSIDCAGFIKHLSDAQKRKKYKEFFEKEVIKGNGCWEWKGKLSKDGYPRVVCRKQYGSQRANRASWTIYKGKIPKGKVVMHLCDNKICTNPDHLKLGTPKQNSKDMVFKGRSVIGVRNANAKLDDDKVKEIKRMIAQGISYPKIAIMFKVASDTISRIGRGISWKHIT